MFTQTKKLAHGCPIEWKSDETEVHEVLVEGYGFTHLSWDIIRRCQNEKDSFIIVSGHERGSGKTTWTQHYIRSELYPEMYRYGFVQNGGIWPWRDWTVCFDPSEFEEKQNLELPYPYWGVMQDDEAIKNLNRRKAMHGRQKDDVEDMITGRFLRKVILACSTNVLRVDTAVLEDVATHWVHIAKSWKGGALIKIRRRCPFYTEPSKKIYWDCMAHRVYPYTFPRPLLNEFKAFKKNKWDEWQRKRMEPIKKKSPKQKEDSTTFGSRVLESEPNIEELENLHSKNSKREAFPLLYADK